MISVVVATAGCSAPHGASMVQELPGLAELGPTLSADDGSSGAFRLGAGDALGYAIFVNSIAYARANGGRLPSYASAEQSVEASE